MVAVKTPAQLYVYGAAALALVTVGVVLYVLANPKRAAKGVVDLAGNIVAGTVVGLGEQFGVPDTDADKCAACLAAGDRWGASQYCPAGTFLKSLVNGKAQVMNRPAGPVLLTPTVGDLPIDARAGTLDPEFERPDFGIPQG